MLIIGFDFFGGNCGINVKLMLGMSELYAVIGLVIVKFILRMFIGFLDFRKKNFFVFFIEVFFIFCKIIIWN